MAAGGHFALYLPTCPASTYLPCVYPLALHLLTCPTYAHALFTTHDAIPLPFPKYNSLPHPTVATPLLSHMFHPPLPLPAPPALALSCRSLTYPPCLSLAHPPPCPCLTHALLLLTMHTLMCCNRSSQHRHLIWTSSSSSSSSP